MRWTLLFIILFIEKVYGLDAVITALETPMLKYDSYDAPVVQYLRKGDVIKIHPSLNNDTRYDHLAPSPEKMAKIKKEIESSQEWKQDPLFKGKPTHINVDDEFIPTLDRQGKVVYVIRDHLYVYFSNPKELDQTVLHKDPTDYRLEEPLPKHYPLYSPTGYRGQLILGITQPYYESYPYPANVKTKGYMSPIDVNFTLLRQTPDDKFDRFYLGGTFNIRSFSNSYLLYNGNETKEQGFKLGVGPCISYDAYKGIKNRISVYGNINVYFFNQLNILQENDGIEEQRNYRAINLSPRIGAQFHRKKIFEDLDFVVGTSMEMEPATTYKTSSGANRSDWWQSTQNDKFKTNATFTLAGYIGFQTAY